MSSQHDFSIASDNDIIDSFLDAEDDIDVEELFKQYKGVNPKEVPQKEKDLGSEALKQKNYEKAIIHTKNALVCFDHLIREKIFTENDEEEIIDMIELVQVKCHLNLSLCYLKTEDHHKVIKYASNVLRLEGKHEKAFYRRGLAYKNLGEYENAEKDLKECLMMDKDNKEVNKAYQAVILEKDKAKIKLQKVKKQLNELFMKQEKLNGIYGNSDPIEESVLIENQTNSGIFSLSFNYAWYKIQQFLTYLISIVLAYIVNFFVSDQVKKTDTYHEKSIIGKAIYWFFTPSRLLINSICYHWRLSFLLTLNLITETVCKKRIPSQFYKPQIVFDEID